MNTPLHRLTKKEIVWLGNHNCKHGHTFLTHYKCYEKENPDTERVGFLDIEATNLDADWGFILSYCIKKAGEPKIYEGIISKKDIDSSRAGNEDKVVVKKLIEDIGNFDKIVGYYSKRYDLPYIRARAVSMGIEFPEYGTITHIDLYDTLRHKFKLSSRRQENACRVLLGSTNKTRVDGKYWRAASRGDKGALSYIIKHNRADVVDLERLYNKVIKFQRKNDSSI